MYNKELENIKELTNDINELLILLKQKLEYIETSNGTKMEIIFENNRIEIKESE